MPGADPKIRPGGIFDEPSVRLPDLTPFLLSREPMVVPSPRIWAISEADVFWKLSSNAEFLAYKQLICHEDIYQKTDKTMKILPDYIIFIYEALEIKAYELIYFSSF